MTGSVADRQQHEAERSGTGTLTAAHRAWNGRAVRRSCVTQLWRSVDHRCLGTDRRAVLGPNRGDAGLRGAASAVERPLPCTTARTERGPMPPRAVASGTYTATLASPPHLTADEHAPVPATIAVPTPSATVPCRRCQFAHSPCLMAVVAYSPWPYSTPARQSASATVTAAVWWSVL